MSSIFNTSKKSRETVIYVCDHGGRPDKCMLCYPQKYSKFKYCEHGNRLTYCKTCNIDKLCIHGNFKYKCVRCRQQNTKEPSNGPIDAIILDHEDKSLITDTERK